MKSRRRRRQKAAEFIIEAPPTRRPARESRRLLTILDEIEREQTNRENPTMARPACNNAFVLAAAENPNTQLMLLTQ
jgi:hypothetical protein